MRQSSQVSQSFAYAESRSLWKRPELQLRWLMNLHDANAKTFINVGDIEEAITIIVIVFPCVSTHSIDGNGPKAVSVATFFRGLLSSRILATITVAITSHELTVCGLMGLSYPCASIEKSTRVSYLPTSLGVWVSFCCIIFQAQASLYLSNLRMMYQLAYLCRSKIRLSIP